MGAGLAAYGAVAVYHVAGFTPEARDLGEALIRPDAQRLVIENLDDAYRVMDADPDLRQIDLVTVGCPHASLTEIEQVAEYLRGKTLATRLWVTTGEITRRAAAELGYVQVIEAAGGEVVADTCAVVAPMRMLDVRSMATNAGKMACYAPMHSGVRMRFGDLEAVFGCGGDGGVAGEIVCVTNGRGSASDPCRYNCMMIQLYRLGGDNDRVRYNEYPFAERDLS